MLDATTRARILNAVTEYDRKESTKKHYNRYALGMYIGQIETVNEYTENGWTLREAIIKSYLGRLCDRVLKELKLEKMTKDEAKYGILR